MAYIIKGPIAKEVTCDSCSAVIGYLPEDVETHRGTDYGGGASGHQRVKCPRDKCPGHGYIKRW